MSHGLQAGEAPTEDVERDWERLERDRSQLWDMKRQVMLLTVIGVTILLYFFFLFS